MSLTDLASIGSFVSGLGVIVSLVYLARQIRQNTMSHRASAYEAHRAFVRDQIGISLDPVLGPIRARVEAGDETLTDAEYGQYIALSTSWFVGQDHLIWLRDNKVLDPVAWDGEDLAIGGMLTVPAMQATWESMFKRLATPAFRKVVEQHLANPSPLAEVPTLEQWKAALAAAKRGKASA
jgi:hypothetical protein